MMYNTRLMGFTLTLVQILWRLVQARTSAREIFGHTRRISAHNVVRADSHSCVCMQVGPQGEMARLGLVEGTPQPACASQLYDWELATAALAAAHAVTRELKLAAAEALPSYHPPTAPPLHGPGGTLLQLHNKLLGVLATLAH
jgi:hypothetical protein